MSQENKKRCRYCRKPLHKPGYCSDECCAKYKRVFIPAWYRTKRYAWTELREFVLNREQYRCGFCGAEITMETANIDHVRPWKFGGKTSPYNLLAICRDCNKTKGNRYAWKVALEVGANSQRLQERVKRQLRHVRR